MTTYNVNITPGRIRLHAGFSQGRDAAIIDIAQDLLLRHLADEGLLSELAFKGGTALRKLYAGNQGRFSLDLDFDVAQIGTDSDTILDLLKEIVSGLTLGPFTYGIIHNKTKRLLTVESPLGSPGEALTSKLDVSSPPWLEPVSRAWVPMPIHDTYGGPLPQITAIRLEENVAEKIARLNHTTTARDVYDLVWLRQHYREDGGLDTDLVRRLAVLKIWVDKYGVNTADGANWKPAHDSKPFQPDVWLRLRPGTDFDPEDIGLLAVPPPDFNDLARDLVDGYAFLRDLDPDEEVVAKNLAGDRGLVLRMLTELPGGRLQDLY